MKLRISRARRSQGGQSMVEGLVLAVIALALVALPWDGRAGSDSVVVLMLKAIKTAFEKFVGALSLPI